MNKTRMKALTIINVLLLLVLLTSGAIGFWQETRIIDANNRVAVGEKNLPLKLKGVIYFVSKKQLIQYDVVIYTFIISIFLNACLIVIRKTQKNKTINWEKYWEKQRESAKYHKH